MVNDAIWKSETVTFFLDIVCSPTMANKVRLTSVTNGQIYDQNGNTVSTLDMAKGDSVRLMYDNGKWIKVNHYS